MNIDRCTDIMNKATGAILEKNYKDFLLNCNTLGKDARNEFYREKTEQLLDSISRSCKNMLLRSFDLPGVSLTATNELIQDVKTRKKLKR